MIVFPTHDDFSAVYVGLHGWQTSAGLEVPKGAYGISRYEWFVMTLAMTCRDIYIRQHGNLEGIPKKDRRFRRSTESTYEKNGTESIDPAWVLSGAIVVQTALANMDGWSKASPIAISPRPTRDLRKYAGYFKHVLAELIVVANRALLSPPVSRNSKPYMILLTYDTSNGNYVVYGPSFDKMKVYKRTKHGLESTGDLFQSLPAEYDGVSEPTRISLKDIRSKYGPVLTERLLEDIVSGKIVPKTFKTEG